jgi:hypothetical protein
MAPDLELRYSGPNHEGIAGNFDLVGASVISRCKKSMALDGEIAAIEISEADALCLNGLRLVLIAQNASTREFRTWPDKQIKVIQHLDDPGSHFTAHHSNGEVIQYGTTPGTRPSANGKTLAWLAETRNDPRGNTIAFGYCFVEEEGDVKEFALDEVHYGLFEGEDAERIVSFQYGEKEKTQSFYEAGVELRQSLRLDNVSLLANDRIVRHYELGYDESAATKRTRLASIEECAGTGECFAPTFFHYGEANSGFDDVITQIAAPLSLRSSPLLADFTGDGLADWLTPDVIAFSTPANPITEWRLATNTGNELGAEKEIFLQEWAITDSDGPSNPALLQPELGVMLDYDQNGLNDILLYDATGSKNNFVVLLAKGDSSFQEIDTQIPRPFPIGPAPKGLRNELGATHLSDVTGDSVNDLLTCSDQETGVLATWKLHAWKPGGFTMTGETVPVLDGIPCSVEMHPVDTNGDSITDLVFPGYFSQGGGAVESTGNYSVAQRKSTGEWEVFDLGLQVSKYGRTLFLDVNADGFPDAISADPAGRLVTTMNTGKGNLALARHEFGLNLENR